MHVESISPFPFLFFTLFSPFERERERFIPRRFVRLGRVLDRCRRRTWGQKTRSKREIGGGGEREGGGTSHPDNEGPALSCANIFLDVCLHRRGQHSGANTRDSVGRVWIIISPFVIIRAEASHPGREFGKQNRSRRTALRSFFSSLFLSRSMDPVDGT